MTGDFPNWAKTLPDTSAAPKQSLEHLPTVDDGWTVGEPIDTAGL